MNFLQVQKNTAEGPGGRMGHQMFLVGENKLLVIGGHYKDWQNTEMTFNHWKYNAFIYDILKSKWQRCVSFSEIDLHYVLQRSLFGAAKSEDGRVFFTGGNLYDSVQKKVTKYCINEIFAMTLIEENLFKVEKITFALKDFPKQHDFCLASCTMSYNR